MNEYQMTDAVIEALGTDHAEGLFRWVSKHNSWRGTTTVDEMVTGWAAHLTTLQNATLTIQHGRSYDGGFDYAGLASETLDRDTLSQLESELEDVASLRNLSGYAILSERAIQMLGESFTVAQLRAYCAETAVLLAEREANHTANLVHCTCGHSAPKNQVMSASRGTACPDCYDRMSD